MDNVRKPKQVIKDFFNLHADKAEFDEIEQRIVSGGTIQGTNMCILILAILIASIGLNMNSTAVIIGAMLISPLMGTIMAMGYGIATANINYTRNAAMGFIFQVLVCLVTSTIYFSISPLSTATSELLARTSPTIWDVLIATCGGLAGAIGTTRKERTGNILPGVAIATALMPPLCTAGYGLAIHSLQYFLGALYLFLINTYFIAFTTVVVLLMLNVPVYGGGERTSINPARKKLLHRKLVLGTCIFILPSIIMGMKVVQDSIKENSGTVFEQSNNFNTNTIAKELKIFCPDVSRYEIGNVDIWDADTDQIQTRLIATVFLKKEISDEDKQKLTALIELNTLAEEVNYQIDDSSTAAQ